MDGTCVETKKWILLEPISYTLIPYLYRLTTDWGIIIYVTISPVFSENPFTNVRYTNDSYLPSLPKIIIMYQILLNI